MKNTNKNNKWRKRIQMKTILKIAIKIIKDNNNNNTMIIMMDLKLRLIRNRIQNRKFNKIKICKIIMILYIINNKKNWDLNKMKMKENTKKHKNKTNKNYKNYKILNKTNQN